MAEEIVLQIVWTNSASASFGNIVDYLLQKWTDKEVTKFVQQTNEMLFKLKRYPEMGRASTKRKTVRILLLNNHTQLVYQYKQRKKQIEILLFWNMKQNPAKFKY
jgi:plasmid stabilization system protein ParE